jgi:DNA-binding MarR family transcriptional regulator
MTAGRRGALPNQQKKNETIAPNVVRDLAWFRYELRRFLRFSEKAARSEGVTPQQHQLMLGIAGYTDASKATISELAEFLQEHHNSVVELVGRAVRGGLVRKEHDRRDRRYVFVSLTHRGEVVLSRLAKLHKKEVERLRAGLMTERRSSGTSAGIEAVLRKQRVYGAREVQPRN